MQHKPEIIIQHREALAELLTEAAEIEHNLMCCYLFAAWSLKSGADEGLSQTQAEAVARWRGLITHVAIDEMTHFANANNMLSAIGARPRLGRPNFPVGPGYHPADVLVELHPFSASTIDHFVFLERPEGVDLPDGQSFGHPSSYVRAITAQTIMPTAQDYQTVGHLYRSIRQGFETLAHQHGESALFLGDPQAQISPADVRLQGLVQVHDLASALQAIDNIVEQGEGNVDDPQGSHYRKFCSVRDELRALSAADPAFEPARAVVKNPVQRKPPMPQNKVHISDPQAARVLDLGNALYNHMLRILGAAYEPLAPSTRSGLLDEGITAMTLLVPLNEVLTRLPASQEGGPARAGMSFAVTREIRVPPAASAIAVLVERSHELASSAAAMSTIDAALGQIAKDLSNIARRLGALPASIVMANQPQPEPSEAPAIEGSATAAPAVATDDPNLPPLEYSNDPSIPPRRVIKGVEVIEGQHLTLSFDTKRCIHARFCVLSAPEVFVGNVDGPWIRPDAIDVEALAAVASRCPSGAITYRRKDGRPDESPPPVNTAHLREHGPLSIVADIEIDGAPRRTRAVLCRCGASKRKPYCDGSHNQVEFRATGEPASAETITPLQVRNGALSIKPQPDGPLLVRGNLEICTGTGRTIDKVTKAALCRCGGSQNKPFCDGSHRSNGFSSGGSSET